MGLKIGSQGMYIVYVCSPDSLKLGFRCTRRLEWNQNQCFSINCLKTIKSLAPPPYFFLKLKSKERCYFLIIPALAVRSNPRGYY